ncbi:MAG: hypothetical protein ACE37K_19445 [Planctomycetota bacterium]
MSEKSAESSGVNPGEPDAGKGDLTSKLFGVTLLPALSKLLNPSAELLGAELRASIQEKLADWKERARARNLAGNIRMASERLKREDSSGKAGSVEGATAFEEWCECASEVDPESELGRVWQEILVDIALGRTWARHHVDVLKRLSAFEAESLIRLVETGGLKQRAENAAMFAKLRELGLAKRFTVLTDLKLLGLLIGGALALSLATATTFGIPSLWEMSERTKRFYGRCLLVAWAFVGYCVTRWQYMGHRPTRLAIRLVGKARRS